MNVIPLSSATSVTFTEIPSICELSGRADELLLVQILSVSLTLRAQKGLISFRTIT